MMNLKLLLCLNIILLIQCTRGNEQNPWSWSDLNDDDKVTVKREAIPRVLQRQDNYEAIHSIEQQEIQEFQSNGNGNGTDASLEDVIDEILSSNRQGRNVDGLDDVYSDPSVKEALLNGDDAQARNLIREKLCSLGLMQCEEERRPYPTRVIYTQPPNYNGRPPQLSSGPYRPGPPQPPKSVYGQPPNGIYGPPRPMPIPQQPPRKVGYASSSSLNSFSSSNSNSFKPLGPVYEKFGSDFYDEGSASVKFGYTEKPTIVVNQQGKREADVIQSHVHHHYHHVDGADGGIPKTIVVNNPIPVQPIITAPSSEYSSFNGLSSYQNSGYASSGSGLSGGGGSNGFNPINTDFEYKGVNSGSGPANGIYNGAIPVKPVYEGANQYANQYSNGQNQLSNGQYSQQSLSNQGPAQFTDGNNGLYAQQSNSNGLYSNQGQSQYNGNVGNSFHTSSPDIYKKELNLNAPNRGNSLSNSGYAATQQQLQNTQKYSKNQYNQGEQYQGIESSRQENFDCVCVPYDQCPASDVVGRRDDLILPLDPRHLSTEIEADSDNSTLTLNRVTKDSGSKNATVIDDHKVSKRDVANDNTKQAEGEGRIFGFGGGGGNYGNNGNYGNHGGGHGGKKVLPTLGVSFGLPYPTYNHPISPFGGQIPNPHFGAISPNGLNLGLLNVNPLVSLQVSKNEHGEKLLKPFVNLHVTPNENIIGKIGSLFAAKKHKLSHHHHEHNHLHRYPSYPPPIHHGPPHFESFPHGPPPHFESFPHGPPNFQNFPHGPPPPFYHDHHEHHHQPHFNGPPPGHFLSRPPHPFYKDAGTLHEDSGYDSNSHDLNEFDFNPTSLGFRSNNATQTIGDFPLEDTENQEFKRNYNYQSFYPQNSNNAINQNDGQQYANNYANYNTNSNQFTQSLPIQAPGQARGSDTVSFPNSRRKRDTDQVVPASIEKESLESIDAEAEEGSEGRALTAEKRQAYYQQQQRPGQQRPQQQQQQQQKQCGPRNVCCRKPVYRPPPQQQQSYNRCGTRNAQGINGRIKNPVYIDGDSEFGEYPWQAAILKKDPKESVYVCGGTLIDNQHIITAAHCVKTYSGFDLRVRLGEWDVNHDVEFYPYVERDVISVHVHPDYYAGTLDNDLAILKLNQPVDFTGIPHISPACMPDKYSDFTGARCWTTGWGKDAWGEFGKYQNILKEVDVPIIGHNQCQNQLRQTRLGFNYVLNPGFLCAGGEEGKDACKGDGGGPLVCEKNGAWQVVGIVSWGIGCGQVNVPGVYVKVAHYLDWIDQITRRY